MSTAYHSAIAKLQDYIDQYDIIIKPVENAFLADYEYYKKIELIIANEQLPLFVYDEYDDLSDTNQLLNLCLVFNELEVYEDCEDFLEWCKELGLKPDNIEAGSYYMDLRIYYSKIIHILGKIEHPISSFDFNLNAGAAQLLRKL